MKVELINTDRPIREYLAECASVVRQSQPKDADRLFDRLMKESYGDKPSRMFEFVPCVLKQDDSGLNAFEMAKQFFGHFEVDDNLKPVYYYTNARELLNWGFSWEEIEPLIDFTHYRSVRITVPYFIYGQLSTHTQITSVSHSNRYTESDLGYWMPEEVKYIPATQEWWNDLVRNKGVEVLSQVMRSCGIKRREVYARGADMLQYRTATLGGYTNNPNAWVHFLNQRALDPHTQLETRQVAKMIADAIRPI